MEKAEGKIKEREIKNMDTRSLEKTDANAATTPLRKKLKSDEQSRERYMGPWT